MSTLTLDDDLLAQAQAYAHRTGIDLSVLVAEALRPIIAAESVRRPLSPQVQELVGCVTLPPDFDDKEHLADAISSREHS